MVVISCMEQLKKRHCHSVCLSVLLSPFFFSVLKSSDCGSGEFKGCLRKFQGYFKEVSRLFQGI